MVTALVLNCTLKHSPESSSTELLRDGAHPTVLRGESPQPSSPVTPDT